MLNKGYSSPGKSGDTGIMEPEFYVVPTEIIKKSREQNDPWNKVFIKKIPNS